MNEGCHNLTNENSEAPLRMKHVRDRFATKSQAKLQKPTLSLLLQHALTE